MALAYSLLPVGVGVGCGTGDGVSADACPAVMITTMTEAAIATLVPAEARRQRNRRCFTMAPRDVWRDVSMLGAEYD
jgi:hypothetical protein